MPVGHEHAAHEHPADVELGRFGTHRLVWAIVFNAALVLAQVVGGVIAGSLALLADALHNLNDTASLGIALLAHQVAQRRADHHRTFGYRRAQVIGALINFTTLIIIGLLLVYEAFERLVQPQPVEGWPVIIIASLALVVDAATTALLWAGAKHTLNLRAAFVHSFSDALASVGVIASGILVLTLGWWWTDPLVTLIIAAYVLYLGLSLIGRSIHILLESVPEDVSLDELVRQIESIEPVLNVHHVHVWELDEHHRAMESHVVIDPAQAGQIEQIKAAIKRRLAQDFSIHHATLEFDLGRPDESDSDHTLEVVPRH